MYDTTRPSSSTVTECTLHFLACADTTAVTASLVMPSARKRRHAEKEASKVTRHDGCVRGRGLGLVAGCVGEGGGGGRGALAPTFAHDHKEATATCPAQRLTVR